MDITGRNVLRKERGKGKILTTNIQTKKRPNVTQHTKRKKLYNAISTPWRRV
jgi:hypothetical protein